MLLWVYFFVPETRFKTLEEMDVVFNDSTGAMDKVRMERIRREVGLDDEVVGRRPLCIEEHATGSEEEHIETTAASG